MPSFGDSLRQVRIASEVFAASEKLAFGHLKEILLGQKDGGKRIA